MADNKVNVPSFTDSKPAPKQESKAEAPKAPPRSMFSMTVKKLDVFGKPGTDPHKPIPGYELYWFDDRENYINLALASGWVFVTKDEVAMNDAPTSPGNTALDDKVRAVVGWSGNEPVYAFLMKMPEDLYKHQKEGPGSIEDHHLELERQLAMGTYRMSPDDGRYVAGRLPSGVAGSNLPAIKMGRYYKPPST